ncbi:MAG: hypothetical protein Q8N99_00640 [Nanoarchaeota archaeon]|nr:hypothetical protein [Nanoarchaeota archaeon]
MKRSKKSGNGSLNHARLDIDAIAISQGFPVFLRELQGHGSYVQYENQDGLVRTFDPMTGKKVSADYVPRVKLTRKFHLPEEAVRLTLIPMHNTDYVNNTQKKFYSH